MTDAVSGSVEGDLVFNSEGAVDGDEVVVQPGRSSASRDGAAPQQETRQYRREEVHGVSLRTTADT